MFRGNHFITYQVSGTSSQSSPLMKKKAKPAVPAQRHSFVLPIQFDALCALIDAMLMSVLLPFESFHKRRPGNEVSHAARC